jgi:hypothetical protein
MKMFKVVLLLKRRPEIAAADFTRLWTEGRPSGPGLADYVHNRAMTDDMPIENAPPAPFDAADEFWFADAAAAATFFSAPSAKALWQSMLAQPPLAVAGPSRELWRQDAPRPPKPIKIITLPKRPAGMSEAAFGDHWINVHFLKLALPAPGVKERLYRYEVCLQASEPVPGLGAAPFDGSGIIEFVSAEALRTEFSSQNYREVMAPDEPRFTDPTRSSALMVEPIPL